MFKGWVSLVPMHLFQPIIDTGGRLVLKIFFCQHFAPPTFATLQPIGNKKFFWILWHESTKKVNVHAMINAIFQMKTSSISFSNGDLLLGPLLSQNGHFATFSSILPTFCAKCHTSAVPHNSLSLLHIHYCALFG